MWIRQFVNNHPLYKHDSIVNDQIQYDLLRLIQQMNNNEQSMELLRDSHWTSNTKLF